MHQTVGWVLAVALLWCGSARAQEAEPTTFRRGQGWSVLSGQTVDQGNTVVHAELGWPGLSASLLHGVTPKLDVGGRFNLNYGYEGRVDTVAPGLKLQGVLRVMLLERDRINLGLEFAPGPFFYFFSAGRGASRTEAGLVMPLALSLGVFASSAILVNVGLELPMYVVFGPSGGFQFPILVGAGAEYYIDQKLALTLNTRMGPTLTTGNARFTLEVLFGVAYRL
ncbi:MAG: hypothetical protein ACOZIN_01950 [Myxococcota bacterium]